MFKRKNKKETLKFACPFCYAHHELESLLVKCSNNACDNYKESEKFGFFHPSNPQKCLKCKQKSKEIHCPNPNYGISSGTDGLISNEMLNATNIAVAVVGDADAGKTCYMSSLFYSLKYTFSRFFPGDLSNADERSARFYNECYYSPVYGEKRLPTEKRGIKGDALPICFYLRIKDEKKARVNGVLTLNYSSTNSELMFKTEDERHALLSDVQKFSRDYIRNADAIFLIIDPMTIPAIRKKVLARAKELGELDAVKRCCPKGEHSPLDTLKHLTAMIGEDVPRGGIDKHLAVIFTKMDILEKYYPPMSGSNVLVRESRHLETHSYHLPEHKRTSEAIIDLIVKYMGNASVTELRKFKSYGFFATSALGAAPNEDGSLSKIPLSKRVLDPVLWVVSDKNLINKTW